MSSLKIGIAGTRGIPAIYGGFETFAEELSVRLQKKGYDVTVYCDKGSYSEPQLQSVRLKYMPIKKSDNQVLYFLLSLYKGLKENDILIVTSTGASYFYWLNFIFKKVLITNSDGIESLRSKWSFFKRKYLHYSQYFASKWSDIVVTDSIGIEQYWSLNYPRGAKVTTIEYGAPLIDEIFESEKKLEALGLLPNDYYLIVARLEPENNLIMMIEGYIQSKSRKKLVIVGSTTHNFYYQRLKKFNITSGVVFLDAIYDKLILQSVRLHAYAYLHGHSVGGTNPSLLEGMGCGNLCICHNNIFNKEVTNKNQLYFSNANELANMINETEQLPDEKKRQYREDSKNRIRQYYSWERITSDYIKLFESII